MEGTMGLRKSGVLGGMALVSGGCQLGMARKVSRETDLVSRDLLGVGENADRP